MPVDIQTMLAGKWEDGTRPKDVFSLYVAKAPAEYLPAILDGLSSSRSKVQSGCAELMALISETTPDLLMPHKDLFVGNLEAKEPVIRWEAVCVVGNIAALDSETHELVGCIPTIEANLGHPKVVLKVHSVRALGKMARAYPDQAAGILDHLLAASDNFPDTTIGFIVEVMHNFADDPELRARARAFCESYTNHPRAAVATKARRELKALG